MGFLSIVSDRNPKYVMGFSIMVKSGKTAFHICSYNFFSIILGMIFCLICFTAQSQKAEKALIKNADGLFKDALYIDAYPLYSQLLSVYPDNIKYNYKFSVCMLFAAEEKDKAIIYLQKVAASSNANKKVYYYLGYAYHLNYEFDKAIKSYKRYQKIAAKKDVDALSVQRKIEMCNNGLNLLLGDTKIKVISKIKTKDTEYFRSYDMDFLTGKILVKPDDFKTTTDREKNEQSLVYLGKKAKALFYSSYGTEGTNKDIYMVKKRPDGFWGATIRLPPIINSPYDEDYPIMHPTSNALYFSSKGHNSMGGYDVFKTTYNEDKNTWSPPINLDFAINSTDDDILYIPTSDELSAYFSSNRSSIQGQISVYKIKLKEIPGVYIEELAEEEIDIEGPITLDEIHREADLNVNATEEDLITSTNEVEEIQASEDIQNETIIDMSNDEMIDAAFDYAQAMKEQELKLKNEAEASFTLAREKNDLVSTKSNEAEAILTRINNISDEKQKKTAIEKANNLKADSERLAKEARIAFEIAKQLASEADEKENQAEKAKANAQKIESAVKSNQTEESILLLIEQKAIAESSEINLQGVDKMANEKELEAKILEAEASDAYEKIQFMENEASEIGDEITRLKEVMAITEDEVIKEDLLAQTQELESEKKDTEQELQATYTEAETLEAKAKIKRDETNLLKGVSSEIVKTAGSMEIASVNIKDIEKSESQELIEEKIAIAEEDETTETETEQNIVAEVEATFDEELAEPIIEEEPALNDEKSSTTDEEQNIVAEVEATFDDEVTEPIIEEESTFADKESSTTENEQNIVADTEATFDDEKTEPVFEDESALADEESSITEDGQNIVAEVETTFDEEKNSTDYREGDKTKITEEQFDAEILALTNLEDETTSYEKQAVSLREEAESIDDPNAKEEAIRKAEEIELITANKKTEASKSKEKVNSYTFTQNVSQFDDVTANSKYLDEDDIEVAEKAIIESTVLNTQAQEIRQNALSITDPLEKANELEKADLKEKEAIANQEKVINQIQYNENKSEITDLNNQTTDLDETTIAELNQLNTESDDLFTMAIDLRENAVTIENKEKKEAALRKSNTLEEQAIEKQITSKNLYDLYMLDSLLFSAIKEARPLSAEESNELESLQTEYKDLFSESKSIRESVNEENDLEAKTKRLKEANEIEEIALTKQKEALDIYFSTEELAMSNQQNNEVLGPAETEKTEDFDETSEGITSSNSSDNTAIFDEPISTSELETSDQQASTEVPSEDLDQRSVDELMAASEEQRKEAQNLYESIEQIEAPEEMMVTLEKAQKLENEADANLSKAKAKRESENRLLTKDPEIVFQNEGITISQNTNETQTSDETASDLVVASVKEKDIEEASPDDIINAVLNDEFSESDNETFSEASNTELPVITSKSVEEPINVKKINSAESFKPMPRNKRLVLLEISSEPLIENDFTSIPGPAIYTSNNPIPVNPIVPSGLLYKVQIGAFRNPIPQNLFKGINPIMGEKTNLGFIRYSAGLFKAFQSANNAKTVIREIGYRDAFVVAFYNGARITIKQAKNIAAGGDPSSIITFDYEASSTSTKDFYSEPVPGTIALSTIKELVYTVQIGVYTKPTDVSSKYDLSPVYSARTSNGNIRYSFGAYKNYSNAKETKESIRDNGIGDAFVTAYYNGKRISLTQAQSMKISEMATPKDVVNKSPSELPTKTNNSESTDTKSDADAVISPPKYLVKIGEYEASLPIDEASVFFSIKDLGIERHEKEETIIYTVGDYTNYEDAEEIRKTVSSKGISEAQVIVLMGDQLISLEEYQKAIDEEE